VREGFERSNDGRQGMSGGLFGGMMAKSTDFFTTICGLTELDRYSESDVTHVLSILDPGNPGSDAFSKYPPHGRVILYFHDEIDAGPNIVLPEAKDIRKILALGESIREHSSGGRPHLLVHCHMGISRSTAAMAILLAVCRPDEDEETICLRVLRARPHAWPNSLMVGLADDLLGRAGRLVSALGGLYAAQLAKRPELGVYLRNNGRAREVDLGIRRTSGRSLLV
jgi:predicted protein tyrosine phosphatase